MSLKTTKPSFFSSLIAVSRSPKQSVRGTVGSVAISIKSITQMISSTLFFFTLHSLAFAEEKIPVFPTTPVEVYTIYTSLAVFWLAIIGLIVIIKMKLNEIERIHKLGIDKENENAPLLD